LSSGDLRATKANRDNATTVVVSACLLGRPCRYDGGSKSHAGVTARVQALRDHGVVVVPVCPEEAGGLGTPRPAAELRGGDGAAVLREKATVARVEDGVDVTDAFVGGAHAEARRAGPVAEAILKARSPSCGVGHTHIDGEVARGDGVFAALLRQNGVRISTEEA